MENNTSKIPAINSLWTAADGASGNGNVQVVKVEPDDAAFGGYTVTIRYDKTGKEYDKDLFTFHARFVEAS
jgi:hypothetical protein